MFIKIPFHISNGKIEGEKDIIKSVNSFIDLMVSTNIGSFKPEADFGFVFKNFKFEIFDEVNGTIRYNSRKKGEIVDDNYFKKISETSNNPNNFAFDLKKNIEKYENRLKNIIVSMYYYRQEKLIKLVISGN